MKRPRTTSKTGKETTESAALSSEMAMQDAEADQPLKHTFPSSYVYRYSDNNSHIRCKVWNVKRIIVLIFGFVTLELVTIIGTNQSAPKTTHPTNASVYTRLPNSQIPRNETQAFVKSSLTDSLPAWIQNYLQWHQQTREKYPGDALFQHPNGPKILIRTCLGLCGGLNDRLGQLPWDLYLANQTKRVLLIHWHRPVPLEHFLVPNVIDWTVPESLPGYFPRRGDRVVARTSLNLVRNGVKDLFQGYDSDRPTLDFWSRDLDLALHRATKGRFRDERVLRHRILGHLNEDVLESRLTILGESDMIHGTESFGKIFHSFFRPSHQVQRILDDVFSQLDILPGMYSAAHMRVRHPKATPKEIMVKGKNEEYPADKTGLPWEGETRQWAIETASRALRCVHQLAGDHEPIYLFSDSNDLVRYMVFELQDRNFVQGNASVFTQSEVDAQALALVQNASTRLVARTMNEENAHIDKQKGRQPSSYFGTFADLYLAMNARCVTYGVGYFAVLATKISHTMCRNYYQEENWGDECLFSDASFGLIHNSSRDLSWITSIRVRPNIFAFVDVISLGQIILLVMLMIRRCSLLYVFCLLNFFLSFNVTSSLSLLSRRELAGSIESSILASASLLISPAVNETPQLDSLSDLPPIPSNSVRIFLARHGQTENNRLKLIQGARVDPPINDNGRQQAIALGQALALLDQPPVTMYHSPLRRATQTATLAAEQFEEKPSLIVLPQLVEVDFGQAGEGKPVEEYRGGMIQTYGSWALGKLDSRMTGGGENGNEVREKWCNQRVAPLVPDLLTKRPTYTTQIIQRIASALSTLVQAANASRSGSVAAVAHSTYLRILLACVDDISLIEASQIKQKNCCIDVIDLKRTATRTISRNSKLLGGALTQAPVNFQLVIPDGHSVRINEDRHLEQALMS